VRQRDLTHLRWVSTNYFAAMGMPVVRGRDISEADRDGAPAVAVVDESLARMLYPGQDPVGRTAVLVDIMSDPPREDPCQIVGVVGSARLSEVRDGAEPAMYVPLLQTSPLSLRLVVRTAGDPLSLVAPLREIVRRLDRDALVTDVLSMAAAVDETYAGFRMVVRYLGLFAGIALLLAAVGLYAALAYHVSQQEHEIGVRMAVGAGRADIVGMVLRRGAWLVTIGVVLGVAAAYPGTKLVGSLLFETAPLDPAAYLCAALLLGLATAAACLVPALRATRVEPLVVLRSE